MLIVGNTASNIEYQVGGSTSPLTAEPIVGEISFLPRTWDEVRVGDELVSLSGTSRLALSISGSDDGQLVFDFLTSKPGREPQRESLKSNRLLVSNLRGVVRRCRDTCTTIQPKHWSEVRYGDLILGDSGTRRIVSGVTALGSERELHCISRTANGAVQYETLKSSAVRLGSVQAVLRYEQALTSSTATLPPPTGGAGSLPLGAIQNIEALLGRGDLGDQFMMAFWGALSKGVPDQNGVVTVDIAAEYDEERDELTAFATKPIADSSRHQLYLRLHDDGATPAVFTALLRPRELRDDSALHLRRALFLANIIRNVGQPTTAQP
jgi:hypothetical protein